jgi:hypothetical protein
VHELHRLASVRRVQLLPNCTHDLQSTHPKQTSALVTGQSRAAQVTA